MTLGWPLKYLIEDFQCKCKHKVMQQQVLQGPHFSRAGAQPGAQTQAGRGLAWKGDTRTATKPLPSAVLQSACPDCKDFVKKFLCKMVLA